MARTTAQHKGRDFLGIYLNDHLAGATGGVGLARRMVAAADPGSESARVLSTLVAEITQDRVALIKIMGTLGIPVRGYKVFAGSRREGGTGEAQRPPADQVPLSELEETELLRLGVEGKAAGWRSLRSLAERDSGLDADRLDDLLARGTPVGHARDPLGRDRGTGGSRPTAGGTT